MVLDEDYGGRLRPRQSRRIRPGQDVLSAGFLQVIAGAAPERLVAFYDMLSALYAFLEKNYFWGRLR
jgi:hypothetical protein